MAEYVQVPVSLIERAVAGLLRAPGRDAVLVCGELHALLSPPTPTVDPVTNEQAWADGFEAGATWPQHTASGVPVDPPMNPYESTAEPPRIEEMAPGTTFNEEVRWTVTGTLSTGSTVAHSVSGEMRFADRFDPSTIRDVTPPKDAA